MSDDAGRPRPPDRLVRALSLGGGVAVRALVGTALVSEAARRHGTSPTASAALGRTLMGAVLLAAEGKGETVQIQLRGDGPLGTVTAIAEDGGEVRGYVTHPDAQPPPREGALDIASAVGRGVLAVVRHREGSGRPYNGLVPLVTGTVAQDLAHYLAESEQRRAAIGLGVFLRSSGIVDAAGGYSVHALPGADEAEIAAAEANVRALPGPGELVREGLDAAAIAEVLLSGLGSREHHVSKPCFHCGCGPERVRRAMALLGREELERTRRAGEVLEAHCHFCAETYTVGPDEIPSLLEAARAGEAPPPR